MNPKILIVEDDRDLQRALAIRLHASGYHVVTAEDGISAIATARKEKPDLVLLDLGLPAGNGFTVLESFSKMPGLWDTPVVVLTGRDPSVAEPQARQYGISAFMRKPVDNDVLLATIAESLATAGPPDLGEMNPKILIVEDDRDLQRALTIRLHASGYDVVTAEDGISAVGTARKEEPDLVLLDLGLPAGNGFTVLDHFNMLPALRATPSSSSPGATRASPSPRPGNTVSPRSCASQWTMTCSSPPLPRHSPLQVGRIWVTSLRTRSRR